MLVIPVDGVTSVGMLMVAHLTVVSADLIVPTVLKPSVTHLMVSLTIMTSDTSRAVTRTTEVTAVPAVVHAEMLSVCDTVGVATTVVEAMSAVHVPAMTTSVGHIEMRPAKEEIVAMGVAAVDAEVPVACLPVEGTVEIRGGNESLPLPVEKDIAQVEITTLPIGAEHIRTACHSHQIVEVDLIGSLILFVGEIQFVRHLVCEEQCLATGLLIAHSTC